MLDRRLPFVKCDIELLAWVLERAPHVPVINLESDKPSEEPLQEQVRLLRQVL